MQYIYHEEASSDSLSIDGDIYKYLFKARRHKQNDVIGFRNLCNHNLYSYEVVSISKREALLQLKDVEEKIVEASKRLHIIWAVVDSKTIEKQLPYLNEMGVDAITFFYADFSQKNFKLNFEKFEKILINSSQQCGRSSLLKLNAPLKNLQEALSLYPAAHMLNFSSKTIDEVDCLESIIIGCEGGFSDSELGLMPQDKVVGLNSNLILRSETAVTAVASKILL